MKFSFAAVSVAIATISGTFLPSLAQVDCVDSLLVAIFDGTLPIGSITCTQLGSFGLPLNELMLLCESQRLDRHCPFTCITCAYQCDDSEVLFQVQGEMFTCVDVSNDTDKCNINGVRETCRKTCNYCPTGAPTFYPNGSPSSTPSVIPSVEPPSFIPSVESSVSPSVSPSDVPSLELKVEELSIKIFELGDKDLELEYRICNLESPGLPCDTYIENPRKQTWNEHEADAIACGGYMADISDSLQNAAVLAAFMGSTERHFIGGVKKTPYTCPDLKTCWEWSYGSYANDITYSNWGVLYTDGDYMLMSSEGGTWLNAGSAYNWPAIYRLPPTYGSFSGCNIATN